MEVDKKLINTVIDNIISISSYVTNSQVLGVLLFSNTHYFPVCHRKRQKTIGFGISVTISFEEMFKYLKNETNNGIIQIHESF